MPKRRFEETKRMALRDADKGARFGKRRKSRNLPNTNPRVDKNCNRTHLENAQKRDIEFDGHRRHADGAITGLQARRKKPRTEPIHALPEITECDRVVRRNQRKAVRMAPGRGAQQVNHVGIRLGAHARIR